MVEVARFEYLQERTFDSVYTCNHFAIHELVAPETLAQHTEDECWAMFDPDVLKAADWLRELPH